MCVLYHFGMYKIKFLQTTNYKTVQELYKIIHVLNYIFLCIAYVSFALFFVYTRVKDKTGKKKKELQIIKCSNTEVFLTYNDQ